MPDEESVFDGSAVKDRAPAAPLLLRLRRRLKTDGESRAYYRSGRPSLLRLLDQVSRGERVSCKTHGCDIDTGAPLLCILVIRRGKLL